MIVKDLNFSSLVEAMHNLPLEEKIELKNLIDHSIADSRRLEIAKNYKKAVSENKAGKLKFSSNLDELKKLL